VDKQTVTVSSYFSSKLPNGRNS